MRAFLFFITFVVGLHAHATLLCLEEVTKARHALDAWIESREGIHDVHLIEFRGVEFGHTIPVVFPSADALKSVSYHHLRETSTGLFWRHTGAGIFGESGVRKGQQVSSPWISVDGIQSLFASRNGRASMGKPYYEVILDGSASVETDLYLKSPGRIPELPFGGVAPVVGLIVWGLSDDGSLPDRSLLAMQAFLNGSHRMSRVKSYLSPPGDF